MRRFGAFAFALRERQHFGEAQHRNAEEETGLQECVELLGLRKSGAAESVGAMLHSKNGVRVKETIAERRGLDFWNIRIILKNRIKQEGRNVKDELPHNKRHGKRS